MSWVLQPLAQVKVQHQARLPLVQTRLVAKPRLEMAHKRMVQVDLHLLEMLQVMLGSQVPK